MSEPELPPELKAELQATIEMAKRKEDPTPAEDTDPPPP